MEEALDYYRRAQEAGDSAVYWALGRFYETGTVVEQDVKQAFSYYQKGAEQEDLNCQCRLARCYALGIGAQQNEQEAVQIAKQVLNHPWSANELEDYGSQEELAQLKELIKQLEKQNQDRVMES